MSSLPVFSRVYRLEIQSCWYFLLSFVNYCPSHDAYPYRIWWQRLQLVVREIAKLIIICPNGCICWWKGKGALRWGWILSNSEYTVPCRCVPDRCVLERNISDVPFLGKCILWVTRLLVDAYLGQCVPDWCVPNPDRIEVHVLTNKVRRPMAT